MKKRNLHKDILLGVAVGDALGVPVEFESRGEIARNPVTDMRGYGTYHLPPGTFSDDSSLTFCLAEALTQEFDLSTVAQNFIAWRDENYWTPRGEVFDIGIATSAAIDRLIKGALPDRAGGTDEKSNGNGSLMRILPLLSYVFDKPINERYEITRQVSSITHAHVRSVIGCFYYLEFARQLAFGISKQDIYENLQLTVLPFLQSMNIDQAEITAYNRLLTRNIADLPEAELFSSGYVVHTLEASIWCLLTTDTYAEAVLKAVNLGDDSDTTGAVTGGLAGLAYGYENIPEAWVNTLARREDILDLAERLEKKLPS